MHLSKFTEIQIITNLKEAEAEWPIELQRRTAS